MLDFTVESPKRFLDEFGTRAEPGKTARAPGDRRSTKAGTAPVSGLLLLLKRRRHDSLSCVKPAPLEW